MEDAVYPLAWTTDISISWFSVVVSDDRMGYSAKAAFKSVTVRLLYVRKALLAGHTQPSQCYLLSVHIASFFGVFQYGDLHLPHRNGVTSDRGHQEWRHWRQINLDIVLAVIRLLPFFLRLLACRSSSHRVGLARHGSL